MDVPLYLWLLVMGGIAAALAVDLLVLHKDAHEVSMREAAVTSAAWIAGADRAGEYYAGYLIEKSLSVDNVFVFALLFSYFAAILLFVGAKMLLTEWWHIPIGVSLGVIAAILAAAIGVSLHRTPAIDHDEAESETETPVS